MSNTKILLVLPIFFTLVVEIYAARPLINDDAGVVEKGNYELEFGYERCKLINLPEEHKCCLSLKHGLTEKMDLGISLPYQIEPEQNEKFGFATVGIKWSLWKDLFAFTFSNELGSRGYALNTVLSKDFGLFSGHLNFGYNASGNVEEKGKLSYGCALEYPVRKVDLVAELVGNDEGLQDWLFGGRYKLKDRVAIDLGYICGFKEEKNNLTFGFHFGF